MIDLHVLRIGNRLLPLRVLDPEKTPLMGYCVTAQFIGNMEGDVYAQMNNWEYAPLTIERAEACGFIHIMTDTRKGIPIYGVPIGKEVTKICWHADEEREDGGQGLFALYNYPNRVWIPDVHTLQNLFFSLTGKELTITRE